MSDAKTFATLTCADDAGLRGDLVNRLDNNTQLALFIKRTIVTAVIEADAHR